MKLESANDDVLDCHHVLTHTHTHTLESSLPGFELGVAAGTITHIGELIQSPHLKWTITEKRTKMAKIIGDEGVDKREETNVLKIESVSEPAKLLIHSLTG